MTSGFLDYPALDLGSGAGIPGLVAALFESNPWVLVESEKKKAEWLKRVPAEAGDCIIVSRSRSHHRTRPVWLLSSVLLWAKCVLIILVMWATFSASEISMDLTIPWAIFDRTK